MGYLFAFLFLVAGIFGFRRWRQTQVRDRLLAMPLSDGQREIVDRAVPLLGKLPPEFRQRLEGKMQRFLDQVRFYGNDDLEVTEEMELSVAAQACLLIVNTDMWYENLRTILIYPSAFKSKQARQNGFVVTEREIVRTGESWNRGPVVLSWAHSRMGALNDHDGHNVVLHEFAHQIDDMSGRTNGVPLLGKGQSFAEWERVFLTAFEDHVRAVEHGKKTLIDPYGAEGHEEFFAVSVEVFFERPQALKKELPQVYGQLAQLFRLEPADWL
ncbi:MAG: M90 family metallopeptidase [Pseudomonadota bacterium]